jgi:hypothetical protein
VSFAAITLCIASQRMYIVDFVIESVRKLLDTPSYKVPLRNSENFTVKSSINFTTHGTKTV